MKVLVTGGAGFIGSHVVDESIRLGHRVWIIDNLSSGNKKQIHPKAKFKRIKIQDKSSLKKLFKKNRFDVVNHHAAQIDVRKSVLDPSYDAQVNILGTLNLLNLAKEYKTKKFIFSASGGTAYGECTRPAKEGDPEVPISPYGVAKLAGEKYIQTYSALYGMKFTVFRYANVYGPRQDPHGEAGVVAIFSKLLLKGQRPLIFGNGNQQRDFVYVGDVARANGMALTRGHNRIVNIGTRQLTSVNQLYQTMASIVGFKKKAIKKPARAGELSKSVLDIRYAKKVMGWTPKTSIKKGLAETIDYFRSPAG